MNSYKIKSNHIVVSVKGGTVLMDICFEYLLKNHHWFLCGGYPATVINKKIHKMHSILIGSRDGFVIDHINRDTTDNRCSNLRHVSHSQNMVNRSQKNKTGVRGTTKVRRGDRYVWQVRISHNKKRIHIGYFDSLDAARQARIEAEIKYIGFVINGKDNNASLYREKEWEKDPY